MTVRGALLVCALTVLALPAPAQARNNGPARLIGTDKPDDLAVIRYSGKPPAVA